MSEDYICPNCSGVNGEHSGIDECPPDPTELAKYENSAMARPRTQGRFKEFNELNDRFIDYE